MNIKTTVRMSLLAATLAASFQAMAADPAVVFDMGGKFDKSFNEAAYTGIEKWKKETGKKYLSFEITNESQREQAIRRMAERGASPIVGFVGGMDIPLIRKFECGYKQGAMWANPKAEMIGNMTGTTGAAWNDPARGGELAKAQFSQGVDVVFAAAGGTGIGVYQAAKDSGKFAIGVDSNQNHIQPGTMLTSMLKRVDVAVYNVAKGHKAGISVLGLKEGGVDYAVDANNAKLVTADMKKKVEAAKADIISGKIKVADFMADNACKF